MAKQLEIPGRFTALDGWRGICAFLVAAYHFQTTSHLHQLGLVRNAYLLVDFFFVLSGFVLTFAYWDNLRTPRDGLVMMWRRLGRMWPLHVVVLAAFVALELAVPLLSSLSGVQRAAPVAFDPASASQIGAIPTNLLLLQGLGLHDRLTWNQPSWSISVELWTCAVLGLVGVFLRRWSLIAAVGLISGGLAVLALFSTRYIGVEHDLGLFRCVAGFFVGHLVFRGMRAWPGGPRGGTSAEVAGVVLVVGFVSLAGRTPAELAAPMVFGLAVWIFALEGGRVSDMMKAPLTRRLGLVSYSIYMLHALVVVLINYGITALEQVAGLALTVPGTLNGEGVRLISFGSAFVMDAVVAAYLAAVVALATLSWRYIEMPAQRWWNGAALGQPPPRSAGQVGGVRAEGGRGELATQRMAG